MIDYNKAEFDIDNECDKEKCPRCSMIFDMAQDVWNADDEGEAFEILKNIINMVEECAYKEGYQDCLDNQIEILGQIKADISSEDEE